MYEPCPYSAHLGVPLATTKSLITRHDESYIVHIKRRTFDSSLSDRSKSGLENGSDLKSYCQWARSAQLASKRPPAANASCSKWTIPESLRPAGLSADEINPTYLSFPGSRTHPPESPLSMAVLSITVLNLPGSRHLNTSPGVKSFPSSLWVLPTNCTFIFFCFNAYPSSSFSAAALPTSFSGFHTSVGATA